MDSTNQTSKAYKTPFLQLNNRLRHFLRRLEVDRAVFFGLLTRIWQICAGPVTAILIATRFTPELQGYYYTFASLLALQIFVELGLGTVIIQFASHEWSKLGFDSSGQIVGDSTALSRLKGIASIAFKWYFVGALIVSIGLGIGGYFFFSYKPETVIIWIAPWLILCLLTGLMFCLVPVWSLLEGCNQVANVYWYRFIDGMFRNILLWVAILAGAKLWVPVISSVAGLIWAVLFLRRRYWEFLKTLLFSRPTGHGIKWQSEMLPMQWRIAVSWLSGYFVFSMFTPVLFQYHGAVIAGQMGMTWSLIGVVLSISSAWVQPRAPYFGILIAQKKYEQLDKLFWRLVIIVATVASLGALLAWSLVFALYKIQFSLITRILPPLPTGLFLLAIVIMVISLPFSIYLRAHKMEPIMPLSVASGVLVCISNLILGRYFGATGMAMGFLAVNIVIVPFVFLVWYRCRAEWHTKKKE
ncbi:hypothetical protein KKC83_06470 [Patescibacteria group bacterium]|nr:hypothetical protein [Patescibacteria group bacterium]MBU4069273.1 hypothetical protein [Pseudomonadota bacterium]